MNRGTENQRALLLEIARSAIDSRAVRDGYAPGAYDVERDPEGYVTSLLNALHRWCHENGVDWKSELDRADERFDEDAKALTEAKKMAGAGGGDG